MILLHCFLNVQTWFVLKFLLWPGALSLGMRGAEVPGRGTALVDQLHGQIPGELSHPQKPASIAGHRLYAPRLQTQRTETALCWNISLLHRSQYYPRGPLGKSKNIFLHQPRHHLNLICRSRSIGWVSLWFSAWPIHGLMKKLWRPWLFKNENLTPIRGDCDK